MEKGAMAEEPRRLSDFLRAHRERILSDWVEAVRVLEPAEPVNPPTVHVLERLEVGYDLTEVVEEYAILRKCIVELVHDKGAPAMRSAQVARLARGSTAPSSPAPRVTTRRASGRCARWSASLRPR
jgi:hypothetical protein